jgi:hypothetical protein
MKVCSEAEAIVELHSLTAWPQKKEEKVGWAPEIFWTVWRRQKSLPTVGTEARIVQPIP